MTLGEIALIFGIELHHEEGRLMAQGGEDLPPDAKRGESMVVQLHRFREGQSHRAG
jgi:hypothetical protein